MKPNRERELATMHTRTGRQTDMVPVAALGYAPSGKGVTGAGPAPRTDEALRPANAVQVVGALLFRGEATLKFKKGPRPLLLCEWVARLYVIGQRGRIVVGNFAARHDHISHPLTYRAPLRTTPSVFLRACEKIRLWERACPRNINANM